MRYIIIIIISSIIYFWGCNNSNQASSTKDTSPVVIDSVKQKIIFNSFTNNSTAPDFVVFTAIDLNTNKSKEICCESDVLYSVYIEDNISYYDSLTRIDSYKNAVKKFESILGSDIGNPVFSFTSLKSLKSIGYYDYQVDSLKKYSNPHTFAIIDSIKKNYNAEKEALLIDYSKNRSIYLIHILYNNGVFCGVDCESGYVQIRNVLK